MAWDVHCTETTGAAHCSHGDCNWVQFRLELQAREGSIPHFPAEITFHGDTMNPTQLLQNLGQSIWLDNITRELLNSGTLERYIREWSVTGLTSNPTIFDHAIRNSSSYDLQIREKLAAGKHGETLFFDLAIEDISRAADLFRPIFDRTNGRDGWVSLEVSPLLAHDTLRTLDAARSLFSRAARPNLLIKIPGTSEGLPAIEELIFIGIPVNVTLLFSREQYLAAAHAYLRGIERRIDARLSPDVFSVASVFVSRWDAAANSNLPIGLHNTLGIAMAKRIYGAYRSLTESRRWERIFESGAHPQRLLWASTGTKDKAAGDTLYVQSLAAPHTINTMPESTLSAFADHGALGEGLSSQSTDAEGNLNEIVRNGIDIDALAVRLQDEGAKSFVNSWKDLLDVIASKSKQIKAAS